MIYATHIPKRERKRALRDVYAIEPVAPKFNPWSSCPITFDRRDHPTSIRHGGSAALVLDPIINGFHLTRVLMDGGSILNLLYQDTVRKMSAFWERGCPDLPACGLRHGSSGGPARPIFISPSSRPSRGAKPRGADDRKLPQERLQQAGSRGGGEINARVPPEDPVTQAMRIKASRAPACVASLF